MYKVKLGGGLSLLLALALLSPIAAQAQTTVTQPTRATSKSLRSMGTHLVVRDQARHARTDRAAGLPVHGRRQVAGGQ